MSLTRVGFTGDNNADFALAGPTPTNNDGETGLGGGTTTSTTPGGSTTTTTTAPGGCADVASCRTALAAALPSRGSASSGKSRKVAGKLSKLDTAAGKALDKAATVSGRKQTKQDKKARAALMKLLATATAADGAGTLGVPLAPIQNAVSVLLTQIP
jgi:hypothetical protein